MIANILPTSSMPSVPNIPVPDVSILPGRMLIESSELTMEMQLNIIRTLLDGPVDFFDMVMNIMSGIMM